MPQLQPKLSKTKNRKIILKNLSVPIYLFFPDITFPIQMILKSVLSAAV